VVDTASNQVTRTIPNPTGPHGLVITPDNKWVYASSDGDSVVSLISTAIEQAAVDERCSVVGCALQVLSESRREAIAMAFLDELTHQEVANVLRVPLGTTKTRIRSGLLKLRVELTSLGIAA
jgi:DNA-directed RNA polymerase specialized sigma24 family protein